jgi:hypothetical protein
MGAKSSHHCMTIDEFIAELETTRRFHWRVYSDGTIRAKIRISWISHYRACPISALAAKRWPGHPWDYILAGDALGLCDGDVDAIAEAADRRKASPVLRARILRAIGVSEKVPA